MCLHFVTLQLCQLFPCIWFQNIWRGHVAFLTKESPRETKQQAPDPSWPQHREMQERLGASKGASGCGPGVTTTRSRGACGHERKPHFGTGWWRISGEWSLNDDTIFLTFCFRYAIRVVRLRRSKLADMFGVLIAGCKKVCANALLRIQYKFWLTLHVRACKQI